MKKWTILAAGAVLLMASVPAFAKGPSGSSGKSDTGHLYMAEKDPDTWDVVEDGAWGKLNYKSDKYVFNGHGLEPGWDYTLINYARVGTAWPAHVNCLDNAEANAGGNVHIMGAWDPEGFDYDTTPDTGSEDGYKFWLVPTDDLDCENYLFQNVWNPSEYLFEEALVVF